MMQHDKPKFNDALAGALESLRVSLSSQCVELLRKHFDAVVAANRTMSLTTITDPATAAVKHYADSLALIAWAREHRIEAGSVLDIGTGAGFPAIPIAIARPDWHVTAIDSTRKKVDFLIRSVQNLGLSNVALYHAHTNHWGDRSFTLVVLRAFGALSKCLEQARRFLGENGRIVVYKTTSLPDEERTEASELCRRLAISVEEPFAYQLPTPNGPMNRLLCVYRRRR